MPEYAILRNDLVAYGPIIHVMVGLIAADTKFELDNDLLVHNPVRLTAMVDTGFGGFTMIKQSRAISLGLRRFLVGNVAVTGVMDSEPTLANEYSIAITVLPGTKVQQDHFPVVPCIEGKLIGQKADLLIGREFLKICPARLEIDFHPAHTQGKLILHDLE